MTNITETTITKPALDLISGDVLIGESGGHSVIYDISSSSILQGLLLVETEHGPLYLDPEQEQIVLFEG